MLLLNIQLATIQPSNQDIQGKPERSLRWLGSTSNLWSTFLPKLMVVSVFDLIFVTAQG